MNYISTRDSKNTISFTAAEAIKQGLAPDGGLLVPERIPTIDKDFVISLFGLDYSEKAARILHLFLEDFDYNKLLDDCRKAYAIPTSFDTQPDTVVQVTDKLYSLELWHGPTSAFKDMALQIMPRLLSTSLKMTGEKRTALILTATSGDTGKAALEGYKNVDGTKIIVYYPVDGVSTVQKLQMVTQDGDNVNVCAITGNFDDAQSGVKAIFSDIKFAKKLDSNGYFLSSANSINWGRLAPQIAYYISAYSGMVEKGALEYGEKLDVCVPTGNFGNILAAYFAKIMGLPIGTLICASNSNNVLTDFLATGTYNRNREFKTTISPSMDILISSNLERLIWLFAGAEQTAKYMEALRSDGIYTVSDTIKAEIDKTFVGYFATEDDTSATIRHHYEKNGYLCDTHTAVAMYCAQKYLADTQSDRKILVASTASPYKFAADVYSAIDSDSSPKGTAALEALTVKTGVTIPRPLADIDSRTIRFNKTILPQDMRKSITDYLEIK